MRKHWSLLLAFVLTVSAGIVTAQETTITFNGVEYSVASFEFGEAISGIDVDSATGHLFMVDARFWNSPDEPYPVIVYETDFYGNEFSSFIVPESHRYMRGLDISDGVVTLVTNRAILQMDKDGENYERTDTLNTNFQDLYGITFHPDSNPDYFISRPGSEIYLTDTLFSETSSPWVFSSFGQLTDLDYDPINDNLLLVDNSTDNLIEVDLGGSVVGESLWLLDNSPDFPEELRFSVPRSVAVDPESGKIFIAGQLYDGPSKIAVLTPVEDQQPLDPLAQITEIQDYFEEAVEAGTITPSTWVFPWRGSTEWIIGAIRGSLWVMEFGIGAYENGNWRWPHWRVCWAIDSRSMTFDGIGIDGIDGDDVPQLYDMVLDLKDSLNCPM